MHGVHLYAAIHAAILSLRNPPTLVQPYPPLPPGKPIEEVERERGRTAIKLASNENPLGPSPKAREAIRNHLNHIHIYPDGSGYYLRKKIAETQGLSMNQVVLGAGSTDLIELAAKTFLSGSADEAITSESAFYMYRLAVEDMGAGLVQTPMRDQTLDLPAIAHAITARTKLVYLGNPNNPTGTLFTAEELDRFLAAIPARVLVVLDEAYFEYVQRPDYSHSVDCVRAGKNLLVLRTFSKVHGLAGIRLGYGMGHPELIECLQRIRSPFNASCLAQVAGLAALDDHEHVAKSVENNRTEMKFLTGELTLLGVHYTPSAGNFLLIDTGRDCEEDFVRLLHEGVIVRPMKLYGFPTCLRVTVGRRQENELFLEALQRVLSSPVKR